VRAFRAWDSMAAEFMRKDYPIRIVNPVTVLIFLIEAPSVLIFNINGFVRSFSIGSIVWTRIVSSSTSPRA
jgi:hypothetical protein